MQLLTKIQENTPENHFYQRVDLDNSPKDSINQSNQDVHMNNDYEDDENSSQGNSRSNSVGNNSAPNTPSGSSQPGTVADRRARREIANSNERRRMQSINDGFQALRALLPRKYGEKISKASILQQTAELISSLKLDNGRLLQENEILLKSSIMNNKKTQLEEASHDNLLLKEIEVLKENHKSKINEYEQRMQEILTMYKTEQNIRQFFEREYSKRGQERLPGILDPNSIQTVQGIVPNLANNQVTTSPGSIEQSPNLYPPSYNQGFVSYNNNSFSNVDINHLNQLTLSNNATTGSITNNLGNPLSSHSLRLALSDLNLISQVNNSATNNNSLSLQTGSNSTISTNDSGLNTVNQTQLMLLLGAMNQIQEKKVQSNSNGKTDVMVR